MKEVRFKLEEKPIGINSAYSTNPQGRRFLIDAAKAYKTRIGWKAKQAMQGQPLFKKPTVTIGLGFNRNGCDIDGPIKLILDAMNKIVYQDDKFIKELHIYKFYNKEHPYVTVQIYEGK